MFFHNYAQYDKTTDTYNQTCNCGFEVSLDGAYVREYPTAATEHAQYLMVNGCACHQALERMIRCEVCGTHHTHTFANETDLKSLAKACCPTCCADFWDNEDVWLDDHFVNQAMTPHRVI